MGHSSTNIYMIAFEVRQGTLGTDGRGWGPAGNTGLRWSRLRSGREHWAQMVAVEVRQGTLGSDGRGWGPAGNTGLRWSRLRSGREHWAWLRCGREHWKWLLAVEAKEEGEEGRGRGRKRRRTGTTNIKSNNPHLTGGQQQKSCSSQKSESLFSRFILGISKKDVRTWLKMVLHWVLPKHLKTSGVREGSTWDSKQDPFIQNEGRFSYPLSEPGFRQGPSYLAYSSSNHPTIDGLVGSNGCNFLQSCPSFIWGNFPTTFLLDGRKGLWGPNLEASTSARKVSVKDIRWSPSSWALIFGLTSGMKNWNKPVLKYFKKRFAHTNQSK